MHKHNQELQENMEWLMKELIDEPRIEGHNGSIIFDVPCVKCRGSWTDNENNTYLFEVFDMPSGEVLEISTGELEEPWNKVCSTEWYGVHFKETVVRNLQHMIKIVGQKEGRDTITCASCGEENAGKLFNATDELVCCNCYHRLIDESVRDNPQEEYSYREYHLWKKDNQWYYESRMWSKSSPEIVKDFDEFKKTAKRQSEIEIETIPDDTFTRDAGKAKLNLIEKVCGE